MLAFTPQEATGASSPSGLDDGDGRSVSSQTTVRVTNVVTLPGMAGKDNQAWLRLELDGEIASVERAIAELEGEIAELEEEIRNETSDVRLGDLRRSLGYLRRYNGHLQRNLGLHRRLSRSLRRMRDVFAEQLGLSDSEVHVAAGRREDQDSHSSTLTLPSSGDGSGSSGAAREEGGSHASSRTPGH
jgi:hypothetical protein